MTRPKNPSHVIHVRLPSSEHEAFANAAQRLKESRARLLRRAVRELIGRGSGFRNEEIAVLIEAVYQLKAVARNLNQLLQGVRAGKALADVVALEALRVRVMDLDTRIAELVTHSRLRGTRP